MLKQLPLKREYLLLIGAVVLLLLSYQLALKKTIQAWQLNSNLKQQITQHTGISNQPEYEERKNKNLDQLIRVYKADTTEFRSGVINMVAEIAEKEKAKLTDAPIIDPMYRNPQFHIQKLNLEGDYFALEKVLQRLQSTRNIGIIRSASLKTKLNLGNTNKSKKVTLEVYLEIING